MGVGRFPGRWEEVEEEEDVKEEANLDDFDDPVLVGIVGGERRRGALGDEEGEVEEEEEEEEGEERSPRLHEGKRK